MYALLFPATMHEFPSIAKHPLVQQMFGYPLFGHEYRNKDKERKHRLLVSAYPYSLPFVWTEAAKGSAALVYDADGNVAASVASDYKIVASVRRRFSLYCGRCSIQDRAENHHAYTHHLCVKHCMQEAIRRGKMSSVNLERRVGPYSDNFDPLELQGMPVPVAVIAALGVGALAGLVNGIIITRGKIPPFIAPLGMLTVARGLTRMYTGGQPFTGFPGGFREIGAGVVGPIPMPIIIAGLVFATASLMLSRTRYGEYIYLLGDNPVAARLSGVNTGRMIVMVYVISGLCAALAGLILIARLDTAQPVIGMGYEFNAIAAVVVGGTSFAGGEGTLFGTLLGTLFIETLANGLNLLNVSPLWEQVVKGVVIALALLSYKALNRSSQ